MTSFRPDRDRQDFETFIQGRSEEWAMAGVSPPDWLRCGKFLFLYDRQMGTRYTTELVDGSDHPDLNARPVAATNGALDGHP